MPQAPFLSHEVVVTRLRAAGCVFAEEEADVLLEVARTPADLESMLAQRVDGLPLEHVVGWAEFCGMRIGVSPGVFVPRRRTQLLAREAQRIVTRGDVVVDLCCGTAAVGVVLLSREPSIDLHAVDLDPAAVACARRNVEALGGRADQVRIGDLYEALPIRLRGCVNVIAANAPYVPTEAIALMPPEARLHERRVALDGGGDGVNVQRRVAAEALEWLAPHGHLLVETSDEQLAATVRAFEAGGLEATVASSEDDDATVVIGVRRGER